MGLGFHKGADFTFYGSGVFGLSCSAASQLIGGVSVPITLLPSR